MNLRDIKKDIEYVIGAFIDDCSLFSSVTPHADDEVLGGLLDEAVSLYNELRDKVNAKIPGKKALYYSNLRKELLEKTDALYQKLSKVVKDTNAEEQEASAAEASKAETRKPAVKKAPAKKTAPKAEKPTEEKAPAAKKAPVKKPAAPKAEEKEEEK